MTVGPARLGPARPGPSCWPYLAVVASPDARYAGGRFSQGRLLMDSVSLNASDGHTVACYSWIPGEPKALVQIAHGMGEHARRYDWAAQQLQEQGFAVYANDHRGHGATSGPVQGYMGPDGWNRALADMYELGRFMRSEHPGLSLTLLGHSMGSMLSQQYVTRYGRSIDALVLSGSPGFKQSRLAFLNLWLMKFERWRHGPDGISELMQSSLFGNANAPFDGPDANGYEWLSRDDEQVATYIADPQCGFVLSPGSLVDMSHGSELAQDPVCIAQIPADLPVLRLFGGGGSCARRTGGPGSPRECLSSARSQRHHIQALSRWAS